MNASVFADAFINEFHYDNTGGDTGEFVEVVVAPTYAGSFSDITLTLYNGSASQLSPYDSFVLGSTPDNVVNGYSIFNIPTVGLQNGSPDGFALDIGGTVQQFLSYEGSFTAGSGVASGMTSVDVGIIEGGSDPVGTSIGLTGTGSVASDFTWSFFNSNTAGDANAGQTFVNSGGGGGMGPVIETLAEQNFDIIGPAYPSNPTPNSDSFPDGTTDNELTNIGSKYDGISPIADGGLTFRTTWSDSGRSETNGPNATNESAGDFIGVNSFSGSDSPDVNPAGVPYSFPGGQYNYEFNDGDGLLTLEFDPVDTSGHIDVEFSLDYWINNTSYESDDVFRVTLQDEFGNQEVLLELVDDQLEANASADDGTANWNSLLFELDDATNLVGSQISAIVEVDTNAGPENIFIDNVSFVGTVAPVPEPATIATWLIVMAGVFLVRRRRKA